MTTEEKLVWSDLAIHPGESLAEELEFRGTSVDELAAQSGLSAQLLDKIVRGEKPITATVARTLAAFLEIPAQFWLNLQTKHDLSVSRNKPTGSSVSTSGDRQQQDVDSHIHASLLRDPGSEWPE